MLSQFLVADLRLCKRHCPSFGLSVRGSISPLAHDDQDEMSENAHFGYCLSEGVWKGVSNGVGRPCPPIPNDIVTPRNLLELERVFIL